MLFSSERCVSILYDRGRGMAKKRVKKKTNEELIFEYQNEKNPIKKKRIADEIYKKTFKLIAKYAGSFPNISYGTQEDLIQEASLIFMRCINKFDITKNIKFSTYLGKACKFELRRYKDKQRKHVDNSFFLEIDEVLQARPENLDDKIDDFRALSRVQKAVYKLFKDGEITDKQFDTIIKIHGFFGEDKKSRLEIANEKKCSLQNIGFLYRKAIEKVKNEVNKQCEEKGEISWENTLTE